MARVAPPRAFVIQAHRAARKRPLAAVHEPPAAAVVADDANLVQALTEPAARVAHAGRTENEFADVSPHGA